MSGIDLTAHLVETATKVVTTINEDGDVNYGATSSSACLYRDMSTLHSFQNRNEVSIDGLLWFGPTETVAKGDIYYHPDEGYLKVVKVIKAKRLVADNTTQFIKCEVIKQRQIS
jgi:hypothetical protein